VDVPLYYWRPDMAGYWGKSCVQRSAAQEKQISMPGGCVVEHSLWFLTVVETTTSLSRADKNDDRLYPFKDKTIFMLDFACLPCSWIKISV
jgi:hypothetical protein